MGLDHGTQGAMVAWNIVLSIGIGLAFAAMPNLIFDAVPQSETGEATGFNTLVRSVGASLGSQIAAAILTGSVVAGAVLPSDAGYTTAFLVSAAIAVVAGLVSLAIPRVGDPEPVAARPARAPEPALRGAMSAAPRTRADAVRNYERVLAAASEVLAEKGAEAGVPEIAARAGVGKGTVYRCFPTKDHLVSAVVLERLRWFTERARAAAERPDAWQAFVDLLLDSAERQARDCTFSAGLAHESALPEIAAAREAMHEAIDALMARAQAAGPDARRASTSRDVKVLFAGDGADAARRGQPRPRRLAALRGARRRAPCAPDGTLGQSAVVRRSTPSCSPRCSATPAPRRPPRSPDARRLAEAAAETLTPGRAEPARRATAHRGSTRARCASSTRRARARGDRASCAPPYDAPRSRMREANARSKAPRPAPRRRPLPRAADRGLRQRAAARRGAPAAPGADGLRARVLLHRGAARRARPRSTGRSSTLLEARRPGGGGGARARELHYGAAGADRGARRRALRD